MTIEEIMQQYVAETSEQSALRDILTDLRHYANANGLDFDFAVDGSLEVCEEEDELNRWRACKPGRR